MRNGSTRDEGSHLQCICKVGHSPLGTHGMRLVAMTSANKPSIAINATQRAIRARIIPCMARPPSLAAPKRPNGSTPSIFGGEIGTGMRRVPAEFVTRPGVSLPTSLRVCPDTLGRITKFSKHEPN
jgi:hypothetical protein